MSRQVYFTIIKGIDQDNDMFDIMCAAFALIQTATLRTRETLEKQQAILQAVVCGNRTLHRITYCTGR
jgi:hypothetical protein